MTNPSPSTAGARIARRSRIPHLATLAGAMVAACSVGDARTADTHDRAADSARMERAVSADRARRDSINRTRPDYVVDSIFPIDEEMRRFQAETPDTVRDLVGGAPSRDRLVRRFVAALEARDTAELRALHVTKAEYAWLVFPFSPYARAPYRSKPGLLWMQTVARSDQGITRALQRFAGEPLGLVSWRCDQPPDVQGANRVWSGCRVRRVRAPGDTVEQRLFGAIVEREGRFKLLGFANDL